MSAFKFYKDDDIYYTPKGTGKAVKAFSVVNVDENGLATELNLESGAPTASEALNVGIQKTGATSGTISKSGTIVLTHGHKQTSPNYTEERDYDY
jgi:hypothetical protein